MGKKEKNSIKQTNPEFKQQKIEKEEVKVDQTQLIAKLSKKERKKLRNQLNKSAKHVQNKRAEQLQSQKDQNQKEQTLIEVQDSQGEQNQIEQNESLISINSSQIEQNYGNEIDLNPKGKQGFEDLMDEQDQANSNKVKSIEIQRLNSNQEQQSFHIYHIKKQFFYKVTSLHHEKLNSTHLNENATIKIVDENLLKYGSKQQSSSLFWVNGKQIHKQISFTKSAVFKVIPNQTLSKSKQTVKNNQKDKKKGQYINLSQKLKQNIEKFIRPTTPQQTSEIVQFLRDFEWKDDCLLVSKENLILNETSAPFQNLDEKMLNSNNSLLILGKKNSGKSTLSEYLKNIKPQSVCILDCDIGRSLSVSGCVSLLTQSDHINLWIGQFTPFNCIEKYVAAINKLYRIYREKYFSKKLVINTMGYLNGVGEMIIYEIYHLINPSEVIVINSPQTENAPGYDNIGNIMKNIRTGNYLSKLLTLGAQDPRTNHLRQFSQKKVNLNVQYLNNDHAQSKGIPIRFENLLMGKRNFKSIIELIKAIKKGEFQKATNLLLFQQDKLGNVVQVSSFTQNQSDMRIVLIGKWIEGSPDCSIAQSQRQRDYELFRVLGVGFGFEGNVYFSKEIIQTVLSPKINLKDEIHNLRGLLSEGVDFQKNFYLVNELSLIDFELEYGRIPFMLPIIKGMGSKGIRNNPSKNA